MAIRWRAITYNREVNYSYFPGNSQAIYSYFPGSTNSMAAGRRPLGEAVGMANAPFERLEFAVKPS